MKRSYSNEGLSVAMSQPTAVRRSEPLHDSLNTTRQIFDSISFSQPLHPEYMILSQLDATQVTVQCTGRLMDIMEFKSVSKALNNAVKQKANFKVQSYTMKHMPIMKKCAHNTTV